MKKTNTTVVQPTTDLSELADQIAETIIAAVETDEDAYAIIRLLNVLAKEKDPKVRQAFAGDLAARVYARTSACRDAALAFAA